MYGLCKDSAIRILGASRVIGASLTTEVVEASPEEAYASTSDSPPGFRGAFRETRPGAAPAPDDQEGIVRRAGRHGKQLLQLESRPGYLGICIGPDRLVA